MKILHLPVERAGQVWLTAEAQRRLGHEARSITVPLPFDYQTDIILSKNKLARFIQKHSIGWYWLERFDVFHYHAGNALMKIFLDARYLKLRKKNIFVEFWGSDIRIYNIERIRNKYFYDDNLHDQSKKFSILEFWSSITDTAIVCDHSLDIFLKPYFKNIRIVGQRIDIRKYEPVYPTINTKIPNIIHVPSSKIVKGTKYVRLAIDKLKKSGMKFNYVEVHGISHSGAIKKLKNADIILDQFSIGSHGVFACEAMALGKPVVCYILPELMETFPSGFPIVNANPENLEKVLQELISDPEKRNIIGKESRAYAEKVHDSKIVAQKLIDIYLGKNEIYFNHIRS